MHVHDEEGVDDVDDDDDRIPRVGLPSDMHRGKVLEADAVGFENFTPDYSSSSLWESSVPVGAFSSTGIPTAPPMGMFLKEKQFNVFEETLSQQHEELQQQQQQEPQEIIFPQAKFPNFSESVRQETASSQPPTSTLVETSFETAVPAPPPRGMFLNSKGPAIFGEDGPPPGMFASSGGSNEPAVASDDDSAPSHPRMAEEEKVAIPQQEYSKPLEEPSFSMSRPGPPPMDMFQREDTITTDSVVSSEPHEQTKLVDAFPDNVFNGMGSTKQKEEEPWTLPPRRSGPPPVGMFLQEEKTWDIFNVAKEQEQQTAVAEPEPRTSGPPPVGMFLKERGEKSSFDGLTP
eukprot:scaffold1080_cov159-Amphora_coffeaeformis.AAC.1